MLLWLVLACTEEEGKDTAELTEEGTMFLPIAEDGISVEQLEPTRYLGVWYEIATTPGQQQANCAGTTAEYTLEDPETIGVLNRCYLGSLDGSLNQIRGIATVQDDSYARLLVDFNFGFVAPYNVVVLDGAVGDEEYRYAAVASFNALWVLSRTPQMDTELYEAILTDLDERGYPVENLTMTEQPVE